MKMPTAIHTALAIIIDRLDPHAQLSVAELDAEAVKLGKAMGLLRESNSHVRLTDHGKGTAWDMETKVGRSVEQIAQRIAQM